MVCGIFVHPVLCLTRRDRCNGVTVEVDDFIFTAAVSFHDIAALAIAAVSDQNGADHQNDDQDNRDNADCKQNFTDV